ncbi:MAG: hypothetical protein NZ958_00030 [Bacteroidia bacterium]|nr:hypothetical protein [Bacteroidia bacterium]MDW8089778.1 hypothetical protein [Bacteroidia bacterium]
MGNPPFKAAVIDSVAVFHYPGKKPNGKGWDENWADMFDDYPPELKVGIRREIAPPQDWDGLTSSHDLREGSPYPIVFRDSLSVIRPEQKYVIALLDEDRGNPPDVMWSWGGYFFPQLTRGLPAVVDLRQDTLLMLRLWIRYHF